MILYSTIIFLTLLTISLFSFFVLGNSFFITLGYGFLGVLYQIILNGIVAITINKLVPSKFFDNKFGFYKTSPRELKFYNSLKIKKWKDKVLELGFLGGFRKNKLKSSVDFNYLTKFVFEINKGIATHFFSIFICPLILLIPPLINCYYITIPISIVAIILNVLPLFILKYTKPRLLKLIEYNEKGKVQK